MQGELGGGEALDDYVGTDDVARFELVASYETEDGNLNEVINKIKEGDLVALWMTKEQTRRGFLNVRLSAFAYVVLEYGHLGIAL